MIEWSSRLDHAKVEDLKGCVLTSVQRIGDDEIVFKTAQGDVYRMAHLQECCERVEIESIVGDLDDLIGSPVLLAEEVSSEGESAPYDYERYTWTFYKLATIKGGVTIRWFGSSNGYYSESADFLREIPAAEEGKTNG